MEPLLELLIQDFDGRITGPDSLTHHTPVTRKYEFPYAEPYHLGLRHHDVSAGEQRRHRLRPRRKKKCEHDDRYALHKATRVYQAIATRQKRD